MASESGIAGGYIHGFDPVEQRRLVEQARFLAPQVFEGVDFSGRRRLLEVGCGVGGQTEILLGRFPRLRVDGVDASQAQLDAARVHLGARVREGRVRLVRADALRLPFKGGAHDAAFVCWFLEHVPRPGEILKGLREVLARGAVVHCVEVHNASLHLVPEAPSMMALWEKYNRWQAGHGGDPHVGAKLGGLLHGAGFEDVRVDVRTYFYDRRDPGARARMIDYWAGLVRSGAPALVAAGVVTEEELRAAEAELRRVAETPEGVFFYSFVAAQARA
jgi:SAM-dependent methyltransferase